MFFKRKLACSFCGKSAAEVSKLAAGRNAYICSSCAADAHRIMSEPDSDPIANAEPTAKRLSLLERIRQLLTTARAFDRMSVGPA